MTATWSRKLAPFVVLSVTSFSPQALAEDPRITRAQAIYAEGVRAANEHRDAEALQKFKDAYAIYPGPNILAAIGREKQVLGQDLEAIRDLRAALQDPLLNPDNAARLKAQIAEGEAKLGRLQVNGPEGAHILVQERDLTLPMREPIDVARGPFRVKATFAGKTKELSGDAKPGVVTSVALAFDTLGAEVTPPPPEEPRPSGTIWKPLTFVLGGATLVTGVLALYFNAKSHSANDRSTALRAEHAGANCQGGSAPSFCGEIQAEDSDTRTAASASTAMWIGAGAFLALTGVSSVLWATSGGSRSRSALVPIPMPIPIPMAGPSTAGASLRFAF